MLCLHPSICTPRSWIGDPVTPHRIALYCSASCLIWQLIYLSSCLSVKRPACLGPGHDNIGTSIIAITTTTTPGLAINQSIHQSIYQSHTHTQLPASRLRLASVESPAAQTAPRIDVLSCLGPRDAILSPTGSQSPICSPASASGHAQHESCKPRAHTPPGPPPLHPKVPSNPQIPSCCLASESVCVAHRFPTLNHARTSSPHARTHARRTHRPRRVWETRASLSGRLQPNRDNPGVPLTSRDLTNAPQPPAYYSLFDLGS